MRNALSRLSSNFTKYHTAFLLFLYSQQFFCIYLFCLIMVSSKIFPYQNPRSNNEVCFLLISFKIWIRHVRKKIIFYNIESRLFHYLVLIIMYIEKSFALRRRSKLSTQPFLYRILVSGKLSLYTYSNKYKEQSQDGFPLLFYVDSYIRTYISICPTS